MIATHNLLKFGFICYWLLFIQNGVNAQCNNTAQWPSNTVNITCGANTITSFIYAGEFSITKGYQDQSTLSFSSSIPTDYVTLRKASDNTFIASGISPLSILYLASYDSLEVHINTNASCGNQNTERVSSVNVLCGCNNIFLYPGIDVFVALGTNTITNQQWAGEYNVTYGYIDGALCSYTSSVATDFITIRKVSDNNIIASGYTPLTITYDASMGQIEMHINTNASCGTQDINRTTTVTMGYSIYKGNNDDGFVETTIDQGPNPVLTLYRGGIDDGFVQTTIDQGANPTLTIYRGGIDDGFVQTTIDQGANPTLTIYRGGIDDGFVQTTIDQGPNPTLTIYRGGIDDGFVQTTMDQGTNPALAMYRGGIDDGFAFSDHTPCTTYTVRWMGSESISWHNYQNWECGYVPVLTSDVTIPSSATFMPTISANDEIKSLLLKPGSAINIVSPAVLKLNGM